MQRARTPPPNESESPQAAPRKPYARPVRNPAACRAGRKQCQPSSWSNDCLVEKHSGVEALLRLEQYLRPRALTTCAAEVPAQFSPSCKFCLFKAEKAA